MVTWNNNIENNLRVKPEIRQIMVVSILRAPRMTPVRCLSATTIDPVRFGKK